ncbi:hypothetical protein [Kribbella endophytica]
MRAYLLTAPRWVLCLVYGLPFGAIITIGILWDNSSGALEVVLFGLIAGLLYGVGGTIVNEKPRREVRALMGEVRRKQFPIVFRAARRGAVPADPDVRAAASRLAAHDSSKAILGVAIGSPLTALMIAAAVTQSDSPRFPLFTGLAALLVVLIAYQGYQWRHLKRRVKLLTPTNDLI